MAKRTTVTITINSVLLMVLRNKGTVAPKAPGKAAPLLDDDELRQHREQDNPEEHGVLQPLDYVPAVRDGPRVKLVEDLQRQRRKSLVNYSMCIWLGSCDGVSVTTKM